MYICRHDDLHAAVARFGDGRVFQAVANHFWTPDLGNIKLRIALGRELRGVSTQDWALRLIQERGPVFNWPVHPKGKAA